MSELEQLPKSSIEVIAFENEEVERLFLDQIEKAYDLFRTIISTAPDTLRVEFGDTGAVFGEDGVLGRAVSSDMIKIRIKPDVEDRTTQFARVRSAVLHEAYHMTQGLHNEAGTFSAVEVAIYEGCATVFERDYAGSEPKWGDYAKEGEEKLQKWYDAMKEITAEQYFEPSGETWLKWAFYDAETDESWRVYKVGTWLVDGVLKSKGLDIVTLNSKTAQDILDLYNS